MRFGMHLSFSVGPQRAKEIGARALQIFCGNPRGWEKKPLAEDFVKGYREALIANDISPLVVHATYLINLAAPDAPIYKQSCESFAIELKRAAQLGATYYVIHIGNHKGTGFDVGKARVGAAVQQAFAAVPEAPIVLFENTSGSGSTLGTTFEDVAAVLDACKSDRVGLCLDTCHALAAGYDVRTPDGAKNTLDNIERAIGLKRFHCIHLNDSKGALGSKLDRHEHIGEGEIGVGGFRALFSDKRLHGLPVILETPQDTPEDCVRDLWKAIGLAIESGATTATEAGTQPAAGISAPSKPKAAKGKPPLKKVGIEAAKKVKAKVEKKPAGKKSRSGK